MLDTIATRLRTPGGRRLLKGLGLAAVFAAGHFFGPAAGVVVQKGLDLLAVPALQALGVL